MAAKSVNEFILSFKDTSNTVHAFLNEKYKKNSTVQFLYGIYVRERLKVNGRQAIRNQGITVAMTRKLR